MFLSIGCRVRPVSAFQFALTRPWVLHAQCLSAPVLTFDSLFSSSFACYSIPFTPSLGSQTPLDSPGPGSVLGPRHSASRAVLPSLGIAAICCHATSANIDLTVPFWSAATALRGGFPAQGPSIACVAREPPQRGSDGSPFLSPCPPVLAPPSLSSQRGVSDDRPRPLWPRSMLHVAVGYPPRPLAPPSPGYVRLPIPSSR